LLATRIPAANAAAVVAPLYDLRLADAHLPSKDADEAVLRIGIDPSKPMVIQGFQLLDRCVGAIYAITKAQSFSKQETPRVYPRRRAVLLGL
jgi:hypothetical protein